MCVALDMILHTTGRSLSRPSPRVISVSSRGLGQALTCNRAVSVSKPADTLLTAILVRRRSGIANLDKFTNAPLLLMYGFMCVAATAALWDNFATYLALPVSTTHTTGAHDNENPNGAEASTMSMHHALATAARALGRAQCCSQSSVYLGCCSSRFAVC
jgi:Phosphate transporter family